VTRGYYTVSRGRRRYFGTLAAALLYAAAVYRRTGVIIGIQAGRGRS
jgi:hypothetical protein